jgi:predicted RNase H-like HicB family nuclease
MTLNAFIEPTRTGYSGYVIELGAQVIAVGSTPDEVMQLLKEATEEIIHDLQRDGKPLPQPTGEVRALEIA